MCTTRIREAPARPPTDARLPAAAGVVRHAAVAGGAAAEALGLAPAQRGREGGGEAGRCEKRVGLQ